MYLLATDRREGRELIKMMKVKYENGFGSPIICGEQHLQHKVELF